MRLLWFVCQEYNDTMANSPISKRDRHGRGLRRPIPSKLFSFGIARSNFFQGVVEDTCAYLCDTFPDKFTKLEWRIEEFPPSAQDPEFKRWISDKATMSITLYRIPIERLGKERLPDPRMQIEHAVISAAAELVDVDPWDLIHPTR